MRKAAPEPSDAERALLRAVTYASLFQFPLTPAEARRSLVGLPLSETALMGLYRRSPFLQQRLTYREGMFVPAGSDAWIDERRARAVHSRALIAAHRGVLYVICAVPFVRMVAVSGSLAHLNATSDADLDLFIITKGPRVWSVTTAIVILAKLMGCRKTVCANFVVSDTDMAFAEQDEFSANQTIHLRPVIGTDAYRELFDANPFVRATYPNADPRETRPWPFAPAPWTARIRGLLEATLSIPSGAIEVTCRVVYGWYLRRKLRGWASPDQVRLTKTQMKLHGNSHRDAIARRFDAAVRRAVQ